MYPLPRPWETSLQYRSPIAILYRFSPSQAGRYNDELSKRSSTSYFSRPFRFFPVASRLEGKTRRGAARNGTMEEQWRGAGWEGEGDGWLWGGGQGLKRTLSFSFRTDGLFRSGREQFQCQRCRTVYNLPMNALHMCTSLFACVVTGSKAKVERCIKVVSLTVCSQLDFHIAKKVFKNAMMEECHFPTLYSLSNIVVL